MNGKNLDILWGIQAIADAIGRSYPATMHLLNDGRLPARRVGKKWCAQREALRLYFESIESLPLDAEQS